MESNKEIKAGLLEAIQKLVDEDALDSISSELVLYRSASGSLGSTMAVRAREKVPPNEWWLSYGSDVPNLQMFALKVLSQTCSASPVSVIGVPLIIYIQRRETVCCNQN
ncbi:unnamed protein product [Cuscuta epithymum]|nr:unnamed protein product [Cuscuta epithymum]